MEDIPQSMKDFPSQNNRLPHYLEGRFFNFFLAEKICERTFLPDGNPTQVQSAIVKYS